MSVGLAVVAMLSLSRASDLRGSGPVSSETLTSAESNVMAATSDALSKVDSVAVHEATSIDPSHSAQPNIREYLLACKKKCDDKKNLPASFSGYVSESHCYLGCHWGFEILCAQIGCQNYVKHVVPTAGGTGMTGAATGAATGASSPTGAGSSTTGATGATGLGSSTGGEKDQAAEKVSFLEYVKLAYEAE